MKSPAWLVLSLAAALGACAQYGADGAGASLGFVRAYLVDGAPEDPAYGRYSYLLFAKPPASEHQRDQYAAAIAAWLGQIQPVDGRMTEAEKAGFNVTYVPVTSKPAGESAEDVLAAYDYLRAGQMLRAIPEDFATGLYLVSVERPLGERARTGQPVARYYYNDMSHVQPSVVAHWVDLFMRETSRADRWEHEEGVVELMRNGIAALAANLPDVKNAVRSWIAFVGG